MSKLSIGLSAWGFNEHRNCDGASMTPDGHRYGRPILIDALNARGHAVLWLQRMRESTPYAGLRYCHDDVAVGSYPDLDVLFIEHRWPTYKNIGDNPIEPDLKTQSALLQHYCALGVPVIMWDTDLKITHDDELAWPNIIIADPTLRTRRLSRTRIYLPFWTDWKLMFDQPCTHSYEYVYIGNNYERDDQFMKYYVMPAKRLRQLGMQTTVCGNWLERSPERRDPSIIIASTHDVAFRGRLSFNRSMSLLNDSICTTHITKQLYCELGFVSPRYLEALACWSIALVPCEFSCGSVIGDRFMVRNAEDVVEHAVTYHSMDADARASVVTSQREHMRARYPEHGISYAVSMIERIASHENVGLSMR